MHLTFYSQVFWSSVCGILEISDCMLFYFTSSQYVALREKYPNTKFFLVRIFLYSVRIQENTIQKKTPYLDTFHVIQLTIFLFRLTDEATEQLDNLETLRKAIGFGKYGNYNGSMDMYLVKDFESCRFENDTGPTITMLPTTTVTLSTVPSTTEPTATTTAEFVTTTEAVTTTVSSTTATNIQVTTEMATTTEAVALTTTDFPVLTTTDFTFTTTEETPGLEPIIVDPSETTTEAPRGNSIAKNRKRRGRIDI